MAPAFQELQLWRADVPWPTSTATSASPVPPVFKGTSSTAALPAATPVRPTAPSEWRSSNPRWPPPTGSRQRP